MFAAPRISVTDLSQNSDVVSLLEVSVAPCAAGRCGQILPRAFPGTALGISHGVRRDSPPALRESRQRLDSHIRAFRAFL